MKKELFRQFNSNGHNFVFFAGVENPSDAPPPMEQRAAELVNEFRAAVGDNPDENVIVAFLKEKGVSTPWPANINTPGFTYEGHYASSVLIKENGTSTSDLEAIRHAVDKAKAGEVVVASSSSEAVATQKAAADSVFDKLGRFFSGAMSPKEKAERSSFVSSLIDDFNQFASEKNLSKLFAKYGVEAPSMSTQQHFAKMGLSTYKEQCIAHIYHAKFTASTKENNQMLAIIQQRRASGGVAALDY